MTSLWLIYLHHPNAGGSTYLCSRLHSSFEAFFRLTHNHTALGVHHKPCTIHRFFPSQTPTSVPTLFQNCSAIPSISVASVKSRQNRHKSVSPSTFLFINCRDVDLAVPTGPALPQYRCTSVPTEEDRSSTFGLHQNLRSAYSAGYDVN